MRVAFKMKLKSGMEAEYQRRHDAIWPALVSLLRDAGISNYSIYLDPETNILFAVQEVSGENNSQALGENKIVQEWWHYMSDLMETNPDHSPVSKPLMEVFHLD